MREPEVTVYPDDGELLVGGLDAALPLDATNRETSEG